MIILNPELQGTRIRHLNNTGEVDLAQARVAEGTLAFLFAKIPVEYNIALQYKDTNGVLSSCKTNDEFVLNLVTIHVPKGFLLNSKYDEVLLALLQAGLLNWWLEHLIKV